ncbi:hypothetical protein KQ784_15405, partial [Listeria monocytogenes]|nr:hypothetical protein [Listeria monocytogenes]
IMIGLLTVSLLIGVIWAPKTRGRSIDDITKERYGNTIHKIKGARPVKHYVAVDIGASSGRLILGKLVDEKLQLEEIHRFKNGFTYRDG